MFNFFCPALIEKVISDFPPFCLLYKSGVDFTFAIVLSCTPRSGLEVIMATHHIGKFKHLTLSDRAEIEVMIEKRSPFPRRQGLLPKTPLLSPKKSADTASLFLTIMTRKAADVRNVLIFLPVPGSTCTDVLPAPPFVLSAAASVIPLCPFFSGSAATELLSGIFLASHIHS